MSFRGLASWRRCWAWRRRIRSLESNHRLVLPFSCVSEEVSAFVESEGVEKPADPCPEVIDRALTCHGKSGPRSIGRVWFILNCDEGGRNEPVRMGFSVDANVE